MEKEGRIFFVILIVLGILILLVLAIGFYLYEFHIFKTVRVCIGEEKILPLTCKSSEDCLNYLGKEKIEEIKNSVPPSMKLKFNIILEKAISCNFNCSIREIKGLDLQSKQIEDVEQCPFSEEEITLNIRGKEALELWNFYKAKAQ